MDIPLTAGRRHFHRKSLCDASLEFSRMDTPESIIEACLLTAIGTLGITCGFSLSDLPENRTLRLISRGIRPETLSIIGKEFNPLFQQFFPQLDTAPYPFHAQVALINAEKRENHPFKVDAISILIGWRIKDNSHGIFGFGPQIITDGYRDDDINFLLNLSDVMITAIESARSRMLVFELRNNLNQVNNLVAEQLSELKEAKQSLDHTRFRLSGFNDIFNELSRLQKSSRIIDAFLLILLGIFSARGGYILFSHDLNDSMHAASRGLETADQSKLLTSKSKKAIQDAFALNPAFLIKPMETLILSKEQITYFRPFLPETQLMLIFKTDRSASGIIGLNDRITDTAYGPKELELVSAFTRIFLVFLNNSISFETIRKLQQEQEHKNIELENTVKALSASRRTLERLEKAKERIKDAIARTITQSRSLSIKDITLIIISGILLGITYNYASPGGIHLVPQHWLRPPMKHLTINQAVQVHKNKQALFIDARPSEFFNQRHIQGAQNLPPALFEFIYMMRFSQLDPEQPIIVYGRTISRRYDEETAYLLAQRGHSDVTILTGEMNAWEKSGLESAP